MSISDLQMPYEHPKAFEFCRYIKRAYKIPDENCLCAGDEEDQYYGGLYKKNPNAIHSPTTELQAVREKLAPWYDLFPQLKINESNHGTRWLRKALDAEIPEALIRRRQEMIASPPGWRWQKYWKINSRYPFMTEHGDDWGGQQPHKQAALHNGISTHIGHHHSLAGVEHLNTSQQRLWGSVGGCLIDFEQYAFDYARKYKFKPVLGVTVFLWSGRLPIFIPME